MMGVWLPRGPYVAAVTVTLMVLSPPVALVRDPRRGPRDLRIVRSALSALEFTPPCQRLFWAVRVLSLLLIWLTTVCNSRSRRPNPILASVGITSHFLLQLKGECHYLNGTERMRTVTRFIYNQEEFARFDSDFGKFLAVTELGKPIAEDLNSQKDVLDNYRASVDKCRNNYQLVDWFLLNLKAEPQVTVYPAKTQPLEHHNLLVCSVSSFYPGQIEIRWFRNGQEEKTRVLTTGLIRNGDWTFQTLLMLETVPQSGEVYTCQVEHPSLTSPARVEWRAQSASARKKMLSGVVVLVLGLLSLPGVLFVYSRNLRGLRS